MLEVVTPIYFLLLSSFRMLPTVMLLSAISPCSTSSHKGHSIVHILTISQARLVPLIQRSGPIAKAPLLAARENQASNLFLVSLFYISLISSNFIWLAVAVSPWGKRTTSWKVPSIFEMLSALIKVNILGSFVLLVPWFGRDSRIIHSKCFIQFPCKDPWSWISLPPILSFSQ